MALPEFIGIAAYEVSCGIGREGKLPWDYFAKDMQHFKKTTDGYPIIMGRKTWDSLPGPLPNRKNIILTREENQKNNTYICNSLEAVLELVKNEEKVFIIGGAEIYKLFFQNSLITSSYITQIKGSYECDTYFPREYEPSYSEVIIFENSELVISHRTYKTPEMQELELMRQIYYDGILTENRTGIPTRVIFNNNAVYPVRRYPDGSYDFPLSTLKRISFKSVFYELQWMTRGYTNTRYLKEKGVKIWDHNTSRAYLDSIGLQHFPEGEGGKIYGHQFRNFGGPHSRADAIVINGAAKAKKRIGKGFDQVEYVHHLLEHDLDSRRILIDLWNPYDLEKTALPPCHFAYLFNSYVLNGKRYLNLHMMQRSSDVILAKNFNVSFSMLFLILMAETHNMIPSHLYVTAANCHIYENLLDGAEELLQRSPRMPPKLKVRTRKNKIYNYELEDVELTGYHPHPSIKFAIN